MRVRKKFKAHDENNEAKMGDRVEMIESKPISRHKRFVVTSIVERAK
jgi:small subunit ribosomal protein S17